ncbi:MAG: prolyl oligopeptidase family serine peptidase [Gammaproteobacteria bacterium]
MNTPAQDTVPYGLWPSPIGAHTVATGSIPLAQLQADGDDLYWLCGRPAEGGRTALMRRHAGQVAELTPAPFSVSTRVHEYGGGAYRVDGGTVFFSNYADNGLYVIEGDGEARLIASDPQRRYADFVLDRRHARLIAVCEDHGAAGPYPSNSLRAVGLDGSEKVLVQGQDFYAAPRLSPDGATLAWLAWDHPLMPWEGTQLWVAPVHPDGTLGAARQVAGGATEALCQPEWSPQGVLHFVSDRSGWWNLYRVRADGATECVCARAAEFGVPHWSFGASLYGFEANGAIICSYIEAGVSHIARLADGRLTPIANAYQEVRELRVAGSALTVLGGAPTLALEIAHIDAAGELTVLARALEQAPARGYLSVPESITFPTDAGEQAYAFFYPPANADVTAPAGERPPLIVIGHGGPTGMAASTLKLLTQFWTSRGFAVLDVNYRGSTGFGRAYRDALRGQWGVVDVADCVAGARHLAERGVVDGERLIIRGSSSGGLTVLCALIFHDVFKAGASYYGVADLKGLDLDSHKFESHYNEYLIAPKAKADAVYAERSPSNHTARLQRPMIFFQGLDDKVVPPQQAEHMVQALRTGGVPVAYLPIEGEGHGFRKADTIVRTLEAELYFYQRIFGLVEARVDAPVHIHNLEH